MSSEARRLPNLIVKFHEVMVEFESQNLLESFVVRTTSPAEWKHDFEIAGAALKKVRAIQLIVVQPFANDASLWDELGQAMREVDYAALRQLLQ